MNIYFIGHSSFLIKTSTGKRILTDPFNLDIGYKLFDSEVDLITISHSHFDHSYTDNFSNEVKIIQTAVNFENTYCKITPFTSFHDKLSGQKRGLNIIFKIEIDNIRLCHLGDLGHSLCAETIENLGEIDVLFTPVGENYSIDLNDLKDTIKKINPRYIIPMHYKTEKLSFTLNTLDKFLLKFKKYPKEKLDSFSISSEEINNQTSKIIILDIFDSQTS